MKKKIFLIVIALLLLITTGCGELSEEAKKEQAQLEAKGKEIALKYVKEKYNFNPEIVEVKAVREAGTMGVKKFTGIVKVTLKYKGKEFEVKVNTYEDTAEDNY